MAKRGNNEGTITKLPSGSWRAQITLDGKRLGCTFPTRRKCQNWLRKIRNQIDDGMTYASTKITLGEYVQNWLINIKTIVQHSTWLGYESACRLYIIPNLGQVRIRNLRPDQIQNMYNTLLEDGVGRYTIRKVHTVLHSALQHAKPGQPASCSGRRAPLEGPLPPGYHLRYATDGAPWVEMD